MQLKESETLLVIDQNPENKKKTQSRAEVWKKWSPTNKIHTREVQKSLEKNSLELQQL